MLKVKESNNYIRILREPFDQKDNPRDRSYADETYCQKFQCKC